MVADVLPLLCGNTDLYLSGHEHNERFLKAECGQPLLVSGSGGKLRPDNIKGPQGLFARDHLILNQRSKLEPATHAGCHEISQNGPQGDRNEDGSKMTSRSWRRPDRHLEGWRMDEALRKWRGKSLSERLRANPATFVPGNFPQALPLGNDKETPALLSGL